MKKPFPKVRLGDVCTLSNGYPFKPADWNGTGMPIVRIQNLNDPTKPFNRTTAQVPARCSIDSGDVLLSWSGTPGTSFGCFMWSRGPALLNQHIFRVTVDATRMDKQFFIYAVNSQLEEMIGQAHGGVGLRHITKGKLEAIELGAPALAEQRRIVGRVKEMLEKLDEIECLSKMIPNEITELKRNLVFGMNGREREYALLSDLVEWVQASELVKLHHDYVYAGIRSFGKGLFLRGTVNSDDFAYKSLRRLKQGDFIFPKLMAWEGAFAMVSEKFDGMVVSPEFVVFRPKNDRICSEVLDTYFRSPVCLDDVGKASTGSNRRRRRLNPKPFLSLSMPIPSAVEQVELKEVYKLETTAEEGWQSRSAEIAAIRDAILRKAFAGEL